MSQPHLGALLLAVPQMVRVLPEVPHLFIADLVVRTLVQSRLTLFNIRFMWAGPLTTSPSVLTADTTSSDARTAFFSRSSSRSRYSVASRREGH
jgi:hypothetical protein